MRLRTKIIRFLEEQYELRNSDKKLLLAVWEQEGLHLTYDQRQTFLNSCSTAESITRARRSLQWKFPADKHVVEERLANRTKMQEQYSPLRAIPWMDEED